MLCVSECFYQRSVCGCFVFQYVSTRGVRVGALCFRMFLPEECVGTLCFRMFLPEECVWVLCVSECFYQRSECGCFVFQNVSTRAKCIRVGPSSGRTPAPPVRVRRGRCSVAPRTAPLPTAPSRSHPPWPAVQPATWVRVVSTSAPQAATVFIRLA